MEKEKEVLLTQIEELKEGKSILKNELDERLQEIHRLRVGFTLAVHTSVATEPKASTKSFIFFRCTLTS